MSPCPWWKYVGSNTTLLHKIGNSVYQQVLRQKCELGIFGESQVVSSSFFWISIISHSLKGFHLEPLVFFQLFKMLIFSWVATFLSFDELQQFIGERRLELHINGQLTLRRGFLTINVIVHYTFILMNYSIFYILKTE